MGQPHSLLSFYPSLKDGEGTRDRSQKFNLLQCGTDREAYRDKKGLSMEGCGLPSPRSWVQLPPGALTNEKARSGSNLCRVAHSGLSPFGIRLVQRGFSPQAENSHPSSPFFFKKNIWTPGQSPSIARHGRYTTPSVPLLSLSPWPVASLTALADGEEPQSKTFLFLPTCNLSLYYLLPLDFSFKTVPGLSRCPVLAFPHSTA